MSPAVEITLNAAGLAPGKTTVIQNTVCSEVLLNETDWIELFSSSRVGWKFFKVVQCVGWPAHLRVLDFGALLC